MGQLLSIVAGSYSLIAQQIKKQRRETASAQLTFSFSLFYSVQVPIPQDDTMYVQHRSFPLLNSLWRHPYRHLDGCLTNALGLPVFLPSFFFPFLICMNVLHTHTHVLAHAYEVLTEALLDPL